MPCSMVLLKAGAIERWSWLPQTRLTVRQAIRSRYAWACSSLPQQKSPRTHSVSSGCAAALIASMIAASCRSTVSGETRHLPRGSSRARSSSPGVRKGRRQNLTMLACPRWVSAVNQVVGIPCSDSLFSLLAHIRVLDRILGNSVRRANPSRDVCVLPAVPRFLYGLFGSRSRVRPVLHYCLAEPALLVGSADATLLASPQPARAGSSCR